MDAFARAVTYLSAIVSLVLLVLTVRKLLKETPASKLAPMVSIVATIFTTALYAVITGTTVNWALAVVLFVLGLFMGFGEGRLTRLYYRGDALLVKRSVGFLMLWGLAYLLTMALDQLGNAALHAVGILVLVFGVGTSVGSNLVLLFRQLRARPAPAGVPPVYPVQPAGMPPQPYPAQPIGMPPAMYPARPVAMPPPAYPPQPINVLLGVYPPQPTMPPGVYPPPYVRRRSDSTCLILTIFGIAGVLCSLLGVIVLIMANVRV